MCATWNTTTKCYRIARANVLNPTALKSFVSRAGDKSLHTAYFTPGKCTKTLNKHTYHTVCTHPSRKAHALSTKQHFEISTGFAPVETTCLNKTHHTLVRSGHAHNVRNVARRTQCNAKKQNNTHIARLPHKNHNAGYVAIRHKHTKLTAVAIITRVYATWNCT